MGYPVANSRPRTRFFFPRLVGYSRISCKSAGDVERITDRSASWVLPSLQPLEGRTIRVTSATPAGLESYKSAAKFAQNLLSLGKGQFSS
jgi:hypothetical protein